MSIFGLSKPEWLYVWITFLFFLLGKFYIDYVQNTIDGQTESFTHNSRETLGINATHSSIWCSGSNHTNRVCRFKNLCYSTKWNEFVIFHETSSIFEGLPEDRHSPSLMDFSSVSDHSAKFFNYVDLPLSSLSSFTRTYIHATTLLFSRFHPDNIMHVFHDDLLPVWHTVRILNQFFNTPLDLQLMFMDDVEETEFTDLYMMLSSLHPLTKKNLLSSQFDLVCFVDAFVGLSKSTVWYDYGFQEPQHPVQGSKFNPALCQAFTGFLSGQLSISKGCDFHSKTVVILSRKHNRLVLNEGELIFRIVKELSMKVVSVSLETHTVKEIIQEISCAKVMIGMHGSLMVLGMFLPEGSILVELFPYAVNPAHYTPYKTMVEKGSPSVTYLSWRNMDKRHTVTHPEEDPSIGGISHLSKSYQLKILSSEEVPLHLCCADPEWLFRIYQDTIVDVNGIIDLVKQTLYNGHHQESIAQDVPTLFPSVVLDIVCEYDELAGKKMFQLNWGLPWNLQFIESTSIRYELWVEEVGVPDYRAYVTSRTSMSLQASGDKYIVWIKCILDEVVFGPMKSVMCIRQ